MSTIINLPKFHNSDPALLSFAGYPATVGDQTTAETGSILAPPPGQRIVIPLLIAALNTTTAVTVALKNGAADTSPIRFRLTNNVPTFSLVLPEGSELRLSDGTALIPNLSLGTGVFISGRYYLEYTATGVPV